MNRPGERAACVVGALRRRVVEADGEALPDCWIDWLDVGYDGESFYVAKDLWPPWVVHEFAHWLVASPAERRMVNFGLFESNCDDRIETRACVVNVGLWFLLGEPGGISWKDVAGELSLSFELSACLAEAERALAELDGGDGDIMAGISRASVESSANSPQT